MFGSGDAAGGSPLVKRWGLCAPSVCDRLRCKNRMPLESGVSVVISFGKRNGTAATLLEKVKKGRWLLRIEGGKESGKHVQYPTSKFEAKRHILKGHTSSVTAVAVVDASTVVSGSFDRTLRF